MRQRLLNSYVALREWTRWRSAAGTTPRVYYGFDRIPQRHQVAQGGMVKLQDLQERFPNQSHRPNLLYLVSSAAPVAADVMARMARRKGTRVVVNQNGVAYPAWHGAGWETTNAPMARLLKEADHVVYQSNFCKVSADRYLGPPHGPWEILYNPVDTRYFMPLERRGADQPPRVLIAGSHGQWYRVACALEALAEARSRGVELTLVVAGRYAWQASGAAAEQEARQYAAKLGVDRWVEWRGAYTQQEAVPLMQSVHLLLHTKYNDPCPRLVVEAMACGLPVVYSASGGVPELVGDQAGVGVPAPLDFEQDHPPGADALAGALERVVRNRVAYATAARERAVRLFDVQPWLERHARLFEELAAS